MKKIPRVGSPLYLTKRGASPVYLERLECGHAGELREPSLRSPATRICKSCRGRKKITAFVGNAEATP